MTKKDFRADEVSSILRATVSRVLATALITGIDLAEQEDHSLTQLQQIDMATMSIMAYEEAIKASDASEAFAQLARLRS